MERFTECHSEHHVFLCDANVCVRGGNGSYDRTTTIWNKIIAGVKRLGRRRMKEKHWRFHTGWRNRNRWAGQLKYERIPKRADTGQRWLYHITPSLRRLHWLPIRMRIMFKICTYMFKAIHGLGPEYINCFVERYMPVRALRSSYNGILLKVTVPRKTIGQSSFSVAGPQMWNDLPIDVRSAQSLMMFRRHLKTYLFRRHYLAWTLSPASQFYQNILKLKLL